MQAVGGEGVVPGLPRAIGRDRLIADLVQHVESGGPPLLLVGPPGVGKTFVARRLVGTLAARGADTEELFGGGPPSTLPLGPVAHLVPVISGDVPVAGLVAATLDRFRRRAARQSLALLVDDVDLIDNASATLIDHLSRTPGVTLIATSRTPARSGQHPNQTWFQGRLQVVRVGPLAPPHVAELARTQLGRPLDPQSNLRLCDVTEGNPLWITELLRSAVSQHAVRPGPDGLHLDVHRAVASLESSLADRLDDLGPAELYVLDLIAAGGPLSLDLLESFVGPAALDLLESNGLIDITGPGADPIARYAHPLLRQMVRDGQSLPHRRNLLHQLIEQAASPDANDLVLTEGRRRRLLSLGLWHAELGLSFDPEDLGWAAREAHWGLLELTRRHLAGEQPAERGEGPGLSLGMPLPDERADAAFTLAVGAYREQRTFENGMTLARVLRLQPRRIAMTLEVLDDLRNLAQDDYQRVEVAITHGIWLHWMGRDREGATELLRQAEKELSHPWSTMAASTRAGLQVHSGFIAGSLADLEEAWPGDDAPPIAQLINWSPRAAALGSAGRLEEAVAMAKRALPVSFELGDPAMMAMEELTIIHGWARLNLGRFDEVIRESHQIAEVLKDTEQDEGRALFMGMEAKALLFNGQPGRAADILEEAIRRHGALSMLGFRALLHSTQAVAL
ncbi:MAG TPA: AAA family ATPase, partial [Acidimicrobiales bacterium]|nr:AAA family ATPase [Acidimicrobiales bacterium]